MLITFDSIDLLIGLAVGGILSSVLWWRGRRLIYLVIFALFWAYSRFRVIDINDVMLNALGVAIGYTVERYWLAIPPFSFLQPTPLPTQGNILPTVTSSEK